MPQFFHESEQQLSLTTDLYKKTHLHIFWFPYICFQFFSQENVVILHRWISREIVKDIENKIITTVLVWAHFYNKD